MIKKKFMEWALDALVTYIQENGAELAVKVAEWLKTLLESSDEKTFAAPAPVAGCEEFCAAKVAEFAELQDAA